MNIWNHITLNKFVLRIVTWSSNCLLRIIIIIISYLKASNCKLFVLRIVTWSSNCLLRIIIIIISYLKAYNCKLFVLRIVTWSSNCLLRIIIISYLKTNNYYQTEIVKVVKLGANYLYYKGIFEIL